MKRAKGEVVQVDGGHILRSIGRKDRHSKVYTAKGPRDRRVRLSAHTAIQFYDVQDRLGYERPSKGVDWLITKAKNAIDKLAELPQWNTNDDGVLNNVMPTSAEADEGSIGSPLEPQLLSDNSSSRLLSQRQIAENPMHMMQSVADNSNSKSFFPMNFLGFPHEVVMSQDSIENEDLGLSLHTNLHDKNSNHSTTDQSHFSSPNQVSFEANNPRLIGSWIIPHQELLSSQGGTLFYQREPLQSNNYSNHAWGAQRPKIGGDHQSSISNGNFQFPAARIHGEDERGYSGF